MGWEIPRPYHDNLSPFVPDTDGLIRLMVEVTPEELNNWLTVLISAMFIHDDADYIFPLWNAKPITETAPLSEDTYRDTFADFDPEPVENVSSGTITARGHELEQGQSITFTTNSRVITIPLRGISTGHAIVTVNQETLEPVTVNKGETVELVVDTGISGLSMVTVEVSA